MSPFRSGITIVSILALLLSAALRADDGESEIFDIDGLLAGRAVIVVAAPDERKGEYHRTVSRLRSEAGESLLGEGGVVFVSLLESGVSRLGPARLSMSTAVSLRGRYGLPSGQFTALLIGPDGGELLRRERAITISVVVSALQDAGIAIDELGVDWEIPRERLRAQRFAAEVLSLADREFSQTSLEFGAAEAFNRFLGEDAVELPAGAAPQEGRKTIYDSMVQSGGDYILTWEPRRAEASRAGDLGYTWGVYVLSWKTRSGVVQQSHGKYVNVWRRDSDGLWKVVVDIGNQGPEPSGGEERETPLP